MSKGSTLVSLVQADFNKQFASAHKTRQAETDKILEANHRMTEVWEELARLGSAVTDKTLFEPRSNIEDIQDAVLIVKVLHLTVLLASQASCSQLLSTQ